MMILSLYAYLLRLYPTPFYERFASEMLEVFSQAQDANRQSLITIMMFCIREFIGLLVSISKERWSEREPLMAHKLFRWYLIPFWLLGFSLIIILIFSWSYWGYVVKPTTTIREMATIDTISLVQFDDTYFPTALPLNYLPELVTLTFPPSQILSYVPDNQQYAKVLNPELARQVSDALAIEEIDLGRRLEYASLPVIPANIFETGGCQQCFHVGLERQADGNIFEIYPDMGAISRGEPQREYERVLITPNAWNYYQYILPAAYLVTGQASDGRSLVFVGLASGDIGGHPYHYYEYLFDASNDTLTIRDQFDYRVDVPFLLANTAFREFDTGAMTLFVFTLLFIVFLVFIVLKLAISFIRYWVMNRPLVGQA